MTNPFISSACRFGALLLSLGLGVCGGLAAADDFQVQVWDTDTGLPESSVTGIAQTPDGYLWVSTTRSGLVRFDGRRFVQFDPANTPELQNYELHKLLVDSQGTLWVGSPHGNVISYRDGQFRAEQQHLNATLEGVISSSGNSLMFTSAAGRLFESTIVDGTNRWVTQVLTNREVFVTSCRDREGTIWLNSRGRGLGQFRDHQFVPMTNPPGLRGREIHALFADSGGQIWVGTDKELARWDGGKFVNQTPTNGAPELFVQQIVACRDGSFWVLSAQGVRKCRDQRWVAQARGFERATNSATTFGLVLYADSRGGVWLLRRGAGLWHVDGSGQGSRIGEAQGLPNTLFNCWFEDEEGNFWIGLSSGGLVSVRERIFHRAWPAAEGFRNLAASTVCEDQSGAMWFGTSIGNVLRWRDGVFTNFTLPLLSRGGVNAVVCPGNDGQLWAGNARSGVLVLENESLRRPFTASDQNYDILVIFRDHAGRIWISSGNRLFCWQNGELKHFTRADGFNGGYVLAITEDSSGALWLGTGGGELWCYVGGQFKTYRPSDAAQEPRALANANVKPGIFTGLEQFWSLYADADGVIWIGSSVGGLLRFQDGRFTRFTLDEGLPSDHVSQILEDDSGQIWLGTQNGIARVSKAGLNLFARGVREALRFVSYGKADGMSTVECSSGNQPACWRSQDGHLWFATARGAVWVDLAEVPIKHVPPSVVVEEVWVDGQRVGKDGQPAKRFDVQAPTRLVVLPGRHLFEIRFTAPSLTAVDQVRFKWRLAGLEKDWTRESDLRSASYSFVPPGEYEFQVRACNRDGVWNETGAGIQLTVPPYFWETWWFKVTAGGSGLLCFFGIGIVVQRRRSRATMQLLERQQTIDRERMRIARDIHDQVGANLTKIGMQTEVLGREPGMTAATQTLVQEVADTTREMLQTMDEIVWAVNPRNDNLKRAINYLIHYTRDFLRPAGISYHLDMPVDLPDLPLSTEIRHNLFMAFKEALNNAVKHGHPRCIRLVLVLEPHQIKLVVADDGCGFKLATNQPGADGLDNMRQRLNSVGGHCQVESAPDRGTKVIFELPVRSSTGPDTPTRVY